MVPPLKPCSSVPTPRCMRPSGSGGTGWSLLPAAGKGGGREDRAGRRKRPGESPFAPCCWRASVTAFFLAICPVGGKAVRRESVFRRSQPPGSSFRKGRAAAFGVMRGGNAGRPLKKAVCYPLGTTMPCLAAQRLTSSLRMAAAIMPGNRSGVQAKDGMPRLASLAARALS